MVSEELLAADGVIDRLERFRQQGTLYAAHWSNRRMQASEGKGKMTRPRQRVHEPDKELLSAEDAIEDAERLSVLFRRARQTEQLVALHVPLSTLMEAIVHL